MKTDDGKFTIHEEWGIDWYICNKCHSWPPNSEPYCNHCSDITTHIVLIAIVGVFAFIGTIFGWF